MSVNYSKYDISQISRSIELFIKISMEDIFPLPESKTISGLGLYQNMIDMVFEHFPRAVAGERVKIVAVSGMEPWSHGSTCDKSSFPSK